MKSSEFVAVSQAGRTISVATSDDAFEIIDLLLVESSVGAGASDAAAHVAVSHITRTTPVTRLGQDCTVHSDSVTDRNPQPAVDSLTLAAIVGFAEEKAILKAFRETGYNKSRTAQIVDISRSTLDERLRRYDRTE